MKWEQKIVQQTIKMIAINAFIAWEMNQKKDNLERKDTFHGIQQFSNSLKNVQSNSNYIYNLNREILIYSGKLQEDSSEGGAVLGISEVPSSEVYVLRARASARKKKLIPFFNSGEGSRLRLEVRGHEQRQTIVTMLCVVWK